MYDYLKALFGTDDEGNPVALTFDELTKALGENKDIKLVNLAEGKYVSKEKFDAKETELAGVKEQLSEANGTIQSYKDMDIDGIKQSAADWEEKYKNDTKALEDRLAAQERSHNEEMFISGYAFTSKAAKEGVMAEFIKKQFPYENGEFTGAKEFMDALKADDDYKAAFVSDEPIPEPTPEPTPEPNHPKFSDPKPAPPAPTPKPSLTELMIKKNNNPDAQINFG